MSEFDFNQQHVVVIGGTSGINRGIAEMFAKSGAKLTVASRSQDKVDDTLKSLRKAGADAFGFTCDVRDPEALKSGLQKAADSLGEFDVLVSGAAGNFPAFANGMSENAFKSVVDIDLLGSFNVLKNAYPFLKRPGASVINISAPQAFLPMMAQAHVCAAKAGVDMLTRTLALEWGANGVRVNSVVPGPIDGTEGMKRLAPTPELTEMAKESVPLKRLGSPQDVAQLCCFLGSDLASYISGAIIPCDGGWSLGGASQLGNTLAEMLKALQKQA